MPDVQKDPNFSVQPDRAPIFNANSAILSVSSIIIIWVLWWVGATVQKTQESITVIDTRLPYVIDSIGKLEAQVQGMVSRAEFESRLKELDENNRQVIQKILESKGRKSDPTVDQ